MVEAGRSEYQWRQSAIIDIASWATLIKRVAASECHDRRQWPRVRTGRSVTALGARKSLSALLGVEVALDRHGSADATVKVLSMC